MKPSIAVIAAFLLAACGGGNLRPPAAVFDFGPEAPAAAEPGLAAVEVSAPSWLGSGAMQYRLRYADAARRDGYADSRWAAPPAELLERSLSRRLVAGGRCRLQVDLDELAQVFDDPRTSRIVLEGRVALRIDREVLARRVFSLSQPASTADARGGVAAASRAVAVLGEDLAGWLAGQKERCRAG